MKKRQPKILKDFKNNLKTDNLFSEKDEFTFQTLEDIYLQYLQAKEEVDKNGQIVKIFDSNKKEKYVTNPSFRNQMELLKELNRMVKSLKENKAGSINPDSDFMNMLKDMNNYSH